MGKQIDYPRASLKNSLQLADAVASFAGSCSAELAAEKMGKKPSGAFSALMSATVKYGLVQSKGGRLTTTQLFRDFQLAYTPNESTEHLRKAFLTPPLFRSIYSRFEGQKLPIAHFEKMLIKEFLVPDVFASRLMLYFVEGAKLSKLLDSNNFLMNITEAEGIPASGGEVSEGAGEDYELSGQNGAEQVQPIMAPVISSTVRKEISSVPMETDEFQIQFRGPGLDMALNIRDPEDLELVQVMLRKIERALKLH